MIADPKELAKLEHELRGLGAFLEGFSEALQAGEKLTDPNKRRIDLG